MSEPIRAAITEYHGLGDLEATEIYFLNSGGWEVQDQGAGRLGVWCGPTSLSSHGGKDKGALWGLFIRALIPFMRAPPS